MFEYGKQGMYNVLLGGTGILEKVRRSFIRYETYVDQADYGAIDVVIGTGNFYSESMELF